MKKKCGKRVEPLSPGRKVSSLCLYKIYSPTSLQAGLHPNIEHGINFRKVSFKIL